MSKKAKPKRNRKRLIDLIKRELKARGYKEVEPNSEGGGRWSPPDDDWSDGIIPAIQDCFEREDSK